MPSWAAGYGASGVLCLDSFARHWHCNVANQDGCRFWHGFCASVAFCPAPSPQMEADSSGQGALLPVQETSRPSPSPSSQAFRTFANVSNQHEPPRHEAAGVAGPLVVPYDFLPWRPDCPCDGSVSMAGRSLKPEDQRKMGVALQVLGSVPKLSPHDRLKRRRLRAGHPFVLSKRHLQISVERRWKPVVNGIVERKKTPL